MTKREVVQMVYRGEKPPYVPWGISLTHEARGTLERHYGDSLDAVLDPHIVAMGHDSWTELPEKRFRDYFGVVWNRSIDEDIGVVENCLLPEPTLKNYDFPDPIDRATFNDIPRSIERSKDCFRTFAIGFSLYERAWTMRGTENLMMDFIENPQFVHELLDALCDYNIRQITEAVKYDIDAVHFGDDWGQQCGLQMGYPIWREFIYPRLKRMYAAGRDAGRFVSIHSCGDVDELFDDLIGIGLNCFNPFQPEVMDVWKLLPKYRGRLAFHGGLSTQRTLPYGTADDVRNECRRLLELGRDGGYIFSAAHAVEGDVPLENLIAMIETVTAQKR